MSPLIKVAEITISYTPVTDWLQQPVITTSRDAHEVLTQHFNPDTIHLQEEIVVLYLNQNNRVIAAYKLSKGGITGTVADIRLILATALKVAATGLILAHNHPSGGLKPSRADIDLTHKIRDSAKLMDIKLYDHLILTGNAEAYYSFADEGEL